MKHFKHSQTLLFALSASCIANAQEAPVELDPISITADPFDKTYEQIAQSWYALSGEQLDQILQSTLGETIGWQPGVASTSFTAGVSRPIIRGHGGPRVSILANGIGTQDISGTAPDHAITIDPLQIEQVEILRGPATLLYGGSANGGAVNVVDGRMSRDALTQAEGTFSTGYIGGADGKYVNLKFDVPLGKFVFHLDGSFRESNDYETPSFHHEEEHEDGDGDDHEEEGPVDFVDNSFVDNQDFAIGTYYLNGSTWLGFLFNRVDSKYGVGTEEHHHHEEDGDDGDDHEEEEVGRPFIDLTQDRYLFDANFTIDSNFIDEISASYVFSDYYHGEYEAADELGTAFDLESHETRWELKHKEMAGFRGVVGVQANLADLSLPSVESSFANNNITNVDTERKALFIVEDKPLNDTLTWEIGGRVEDTSHEVSGNGHTVSDRDFDAVSGSTSIVYDYSEDYKVAAIVNYSERAPTAEELYENGLHHGTGSYIIGSDSLDLEKSTGLDLAFKKVSGSVTGELVFFTTDYDGYIFQQATGREVEEDGSPVGAGEEGAPERRYTGVDAKFQGVEANLAFPVFEDGDRSVVLRGMFDFVKAENDTDNEDLPRIPPMRLGATVEYSHGTFLGALEVRHAFKQDDFAQHETVTPSYTMLNARADYRFLREDNSVSVFAEVRNLTDELAYNSSSFRKAQTPLPGRSFNVGLNYKF